MKQKRKMEAHRTAGLSFTVPAVLKLAGTAGWGWIMLSSLLTGTVMTETIIIISMTR